MSQQNHSELGVRRNSHNPTHKWESYINNHKLSSDQKVSLIQEDVKMIEEKAQRKEMLLHQDPQMGDHNAGGAQWYGRNYEVNDMLIDAIKGKLAMLDQIK